ncbi:o-succinylbenzoate synthase [Moritella sp. 5]|uniref:o-succinylbenzoate synthase n=1 Tax=Moritella sp. 5 TaxID=2746231 RepID=UPI001BA4EB60|nr:o-succinylbenzoate synthase [Moritella sp. 5]QUM80193.1 o-succinylbenzoate synthase [Moritella sp. 5]
MQRQVKLYHYQLPLDCAMILRGQSVCVREGWIIELQERGELQEGAELLENVEFHEQCKSTQVNKVGRGEIAPLPGFSNETSAQAKQQLESMIQIWLEQGVVDLSACCPSVAFGFSMALLELEDGLPQMTYCDDIHNGKLHNGNRHHHHINSALLLAADLRIINRKHAELAASSLCKLKIATQPTAKGACHDGEIARQLLQRYPQLRLRLDANRRWNLVNALAFAEQLPAALRQRIDFIEEPCHHSSDSYLFTRETGIAIAWDESLRDACKNRRGRGDVEFLKSTVAECHASDTASIAAIVIKPMLAGTIHHCRHLIELAYQLGLTVVISSSLESSFGLLQLARLSQWLTPDTTPGLDTLHVFKQQVAIPYPGCRLPLLALTTLPCRTYLQVTDIRYQDINTKQHRIMEAYK